MAEDEGDLAEREVTSLPSPTHSSISQNKSTGTSTHILYCYFPVVSLLMNRPEWQIVLFHIWVSRNPLSGRYDRRGDSVRSGQNDSRERLRTNASS
jgi:hypothetical protein